MPGGGYPASRIIPYPLSIIHYQLEMLYWAPFSEVFGFDA